MPADGHAVINARVAQLVEQRIENPRVGSSNLSLGTIPFLNKINVIRDFHDWLIACGFAGNSEKF